MGYGLYYWLIRSIDRKSEALRINNGDTVMVKMIVLVLGFMVMSSPVVVMAHSGGTDDYGCHLNHRTGGYHCH